MIENLKNPRRLERRVTDAFLGIYDRNSKKLLGHVIDMTVEGLKLRTTIPLGLENVYEFRIGLPDDMTRSNKITFEAKTVWEDKCGDSEEYFVGFMMHFVHPDDLRKIDDLINSPLYKNANKRVRISFCKKMNL